MYTVGNRARKVLKAVQLSFLALILIMSTFSPYIVPSAYAADGAVYVSEDGDDTNDGSVDAPFATLGKAIEVVESAGTVVLKSDLTVTQPQTLNIGGKTVTVQSAEGSGPFSINRGDSLVNNDLLPISGGGNITFRNLIIDGKDVVVNPTRYGVTVTGTTVIFENVEIKNHRIATSGSNTAYVVFAGSGATVTIKDGTVITNNQVNGFLANNPAGVVGAGSGGVLVIEGGLITDNEVAEGSNGVIVGVGEYQSPKLIMNGGRVTGNRLNGTEINADATVGNVAVYMRGNARDGRFEFSGTAYVYDNLNTAGEQRNVFLKNTQPRANAYLALVGAMQSGAKVGIYANIMPDDAAPIVDIAIGSANENPVRGSYEATINDAFYFVSDKSTDAAVAYDEINKRVVLTPVDLTVSNPVDQQIIGTTPTITGEGTPGTKVKLKLTSTSDPSVVIEEEVQVNESGAWAFNPEKLAFGEYTLEATLIKEGITSLPIVIGVTVVDKEALQAKVSEIEAKNLTPGDYTTESWAELQTALQQADTVLNDPNATQDMVSTALTALTYAFDSLVEISSDVYVASYGHDTTGDGTRNNPYATLQTAYDRVPDGGTIYVLDNITLTGVGTRDVGVPIGEAKRITISTAPGVAEPAVIKRANPTGYMKVLFQLNNMSQLTLRNIIIDGNLEVARVDGRLFNVYTGSKLIIEDGAILQNSYSTHLGSAIYINNTGSVVEMKGGEIKGNKRDSAGAAVALDGGAFIMTGGLITDNTGGGIQPRGGQIVLSGEANITGNTSAGKALNINLGSNKNFILNGAFTGEAGITTQSMTPGTQFGQVTEAGLGSVGNLIADSGSILAGYDENMNLLWRAFKNELSQPSTDNEITGKRPTLKGVTEPNATVTITIVSAIDPSLVITKEVTADANGDWVLAVSENLETGKYTVQVTAQKNKTQSEPVTRPFEVRDGVYVASYGKDTTGDGSPGNPYATLKKAYDEADNGGTIYVLDDIELTGFGVNGTKSITISTAPEVAETAVIKRGQPSGAIETLFGLTQRGQLTLKNIIIDGGFDNQLINGRIINVFEGSKLIIDEGTILRNSYSQYHGSAIQISGTGSVVEMKGGEIRGNRYDQPNPPVGAAVLVDSGTQFIMTGGLITDNTGGGVQSRGGQILLSGDAVITGNINSAGKDFNINLANNKTLILNGVFTGEAGITTQSMAPGTQFGQVTEDGLDSIENLIADSGALLASYDENKNLLWRAFKNELSQPSTDGEITGTNPTLTGVTEPFAEVIIEIVSPADPSFVITEKRTADANGVKIGCKIPNISGLKFPRKSRHTLREESKYGEEWGVFCDQRNASERYEYYPNC